MKLLVTISGMSLYYKLIYLNSTTENVKAVEVGNFAK